MSKRFIILTIATLLAGVVAFVAPTYAETDRSNLKGTKCLRGNIRQHFVIDWDADERGGTVRTKDNAPLCEDTPLMVSTFTLPENYNGKGWWLYDQDRLNPTVVPQTLYKTERFTMKAGTNGNIKFRTALNPACGRWVQTDAYVRDQEITQIVGKGGIEDRIIQGAITKNPDCKPAPQPEKPAPEVEKPVVKKLTVCNLVSQKVQTVKETNFDKKTMSKNLKDCEPKEEAPQPEEPVVKDLTVCNIVTKKVETVKETDFDKKTMSKTLKNCEPKEEAPVKETPVEEPKVEAPVVTPVVKADPTVKELPKTGLEFLGTSVALSAIAGTAVAYLRSRQ